MSEKKNDPGPGLGEILQSDLPARRRSAFGLRIRNYFLTGLIIAAPLSITIYITWSIVGWVDDWVKPWIPAAYNPDNYLPFTIPGFGLIVAIVALTLLGAATANLFGRTIVRYGELMLDRTPLVRSIYRALKQIFETVLSQSSGSFQKVGLIEYPRKGLWSIVFVSTETKGQLADHAGGDDNDLYSVFLPTTPNPTSGYLLFVPKKDVAILDMSVEEAAKVVISAGLVIPDREAMRLADQSGIPAGELPPALLGEPHPDDGARRKNPETADG